MNASKQVPIILLIILAGCTVAPTPTIEPTPTVFLEPTATATEAIFPSPIITPWVTTTPKYDVIDISNVSRIQYIRSWDIYGLAISPYIWSGVSIWFSNSDQFVLPIEKVGQVGIQSFKVEGYSGNWFVDTEVYNALDINNDEVFTYQNGLVILDKEGRETQRITDDGNCSSLSFPPPLMLAIPGNNQVVSGFAFYNKFTDTFDESLIVLWDRNQGTCTKLIEKIPGWLWSLTIDKGNRYLTYSIINNFIDPKDGEYKSLEKIFLYDMSLGQELCSIDYFGEILYSPQNHLVINDHIDGSLVFIEPKDCSKIWQLDINTVFTSFTINPSGELIFGAIGNTVQIRDVDDGRLIHEITLDVNPNEPIQKVSISPDGKFLVWARDRSSPTELGQIILFGVREK